jgi:hypothetical protein
MANRLSMFSMASDGQLNSRLNGPQTAQVSTTTLLNAIHNIYLGAQCHQLDSSTSLVVNTWLTATQTGPVVDASLTARAWEHARRRAEDGCILLGYVGNIILSRLLWLIDILALFIARRRLLSFRSCPASLARFPHPFTSHSKRSTPSSEPSRPTILHMLGRLPSLLSSP